MEIIHLTTFLQGGAGHLIADLAKSQQASGLGVTVVTSLTGEPGYSNYPDIVDDLRAAGVRVEAVDSLFKRDFALNVAVLDHVRRHVALENVACLHAHAAVPSMLALLLAARARQRPPVVQTMHGWGVRKDLAQSATDVTLLNEVDLVAAVSEPARLDLQRRGVSPERIRVVPCGIGAAPSGPSKPVQLLEDWRKRQMTVLVCLGTVGPRKNQRLLLDAMGSPGAPPNLACAFVGEGEGDCLPVLEERARQLGLTDRAAFVGYQSDGWRWARDADWLVLPSRQEGLPLSILEAYRAGVPVLGSDIPEIARIAPSGLTGFLFHTEDLNSCVSALRQAAAVPDDARRKMGLAAKATWEAEYTLDRMAGRYVALYREARTSVRGSRRGAPRTIASTGWPSPSGCVDDAAGQLSRSRL